MAGEQLPPQAGNNQNNMADFGTETSGPWALEETLKKILGTLQKDLLNSNRQTRNMDALNRNIEGLSKAVSKTNNDALAQQLREIQSNNQSKKELAEIRKATERSVKSQEEARKNNNPDKNTARDNLIGSSKGASGAFGMVANAAMSAGKKVLAASKAVIDSQGDVRGATEGVAAAIPAIGGILAGAAKMSNDARATLAGLAQTGQTVNGSMQDFANILSSAGLDSKTAATIIKENAETSAKLGTSTFLSLQRSVRSTTERFGRFGYSVEDQAKIVSGFYETQMALGRRQNATNSNSIAEFTAKMATLSKLTGKTIDTLLAEQKQIADSPDVFAAATRIFQRDGKKAAENFQEVVRYSTNKMPDALKGMSEQMLSDYGKYGSIATSELGAVLAQAGRGDIVNELDKAIASGDGQAYEAVMKRIATEATDVSTDLGQHVGTMLSATGSTMSAAVRNTFAGLQQYKTMNDGILDFDKEVDKTKKDSANSDTATFDQNETATQTALSAAYAATLKQALVLHPALQQLTIAAANMTTAFMGSDFVTAAVDGMSNALIDATVNVENFAASLGLMGEIDSVLSSVLGSLIDFGKWLGNTVGIGEGLGVILTGLGAWFGGKMIAGKVGQGAAKFFGFGGKAAAEGAGAAGGAGAGKLATTAGKLAHGAVRGGIVGAALEGIGYLGEKGKEFSMQNLARSGLRLGGTLIGGAAGSAIMPGFGTVGGGLAGYAAGNALAEKWLGPDTYKKPEATNNEAEKSKTAPKPVPSVTSTTPKADDSEAALRARIAERRAESERRQREFEELKRKTAEAAKPPTPVKPSTVAPPTAPVKPTAPVDVNKSVASVLKAQEAERRSQVKPNNSVNKVDFPVGDEMQNRQLQEMQRTNTLLAGIYVNGKPKLTPRPSVVMYNSRW